MNGMKPNFLKGSQLNPSYYEQPKVQFTRDYTG